MIVQFGTTSKKRNSTEIPTMTASYSCVLKEGCSIVNPVIIIDRKVVGHSYNTAYISDFGRYYWIRDIVYENARQIFYLECDVLASFKTEIGLSSYYVTRSASEKNGYIPDGMYPITQEIQHDHVELSTSISTGISMYCIGVVSDGSIDYYIMNTTAFEEFFGLILSDNYVDAVVGTFMNTVNENLKVLIDPLQYIASVYAYPFSTLKSNSSTYPSVEVHTINVGFTPVTLSDADSLVNHIDDLITPRVDEVPISYYSALPTYYHNFPVIDHPQIARGDYMDGSRFSECSLITPIGTFPIDLVQLKQDPFHNFHFQVDLATGDCVIRLINYSTTTYPIPDNVTTVLLDVSGKFGIPVPVSQIIAGGMNMLQGFGGIASGVAGAITGNYVGAAAGFLGGTAGMITQAIENSIPKARTNGTQGSMAHWARGLSVDFVFYLAADDDPTDHGQPLCEVKQLNTLSGFILCEADKIQITGTSNEAEQILALLNSGIFYE